MDDRMLRVHDGIASLRAEAVTERLVRAGRARGQSAASRLRRRTGRALIALGGRIEGRVERGATGRDGMAAAHS